MNAAMSQTLCGVALPRLVDRTVDLYRMARDIARYQDAATFIAGVLHTTAHLAGRIDVTRQLESQGATPAALVEGLAHYPVAAMNLHLVQLVAALIEGRTSDTRRHASAFRAGIGAVMGMHQTTEFALYESLLLADECAGAGEEERADIVPRIEAHRDALRAWSADCPPNHEHKRMLVDAELSVLAGGDPTPAYAEAAGACADRGYTHLEALSWERCAARCRDRGDAGGADIALEKAVEAYHRWGALTKVDALRSS